MRWCVEYYVTRLSLYTFKYVSAQSPEEAIRKAKVKNLEDVSS